MSDTVVVAAVVTAAAATGSGTEVRSGGCLCGKIRFTVTGPVDDPHVCNCEHCAKRSGAPFQWWVGFPMDGLKWTGEGEPTWYDTHPGKTARGFCGGCGTHLAARDYGDDTIIGFLATALDDYGTDPALAPTNLNRVAEAAPWLAQCDTRPATAG
ncbi:GFA family protein [Streptomyces sp. NPDC059564]|uniref:GFA family protein n=1 Tax=Streptomyces sp. NPDC059564 TaxID=3346865 RepID=UPI0036A3A123